MTFEIHSCEVYQSFKFVSIGSKKIKTKTKSQNLSIMKKVNLLLRWSTSILPSFKISYKGKEKFEDMKACKNFC